MEKEALSQLASALGWPAAVVALASFTVLWFIVRGMINIEFSKRLQKHKRDLDTASQVAQYELQKEVIKAQVARPNVIKTLAKTYKLLRVAQGRVDALVGFSYVPTFEAHSVEDIEKLLVAKNFPGLARQEIIQLLNENRPKGIEALKSQLRRTDRDEAKNAVIEAKNRVIIEGFYLPEEGRQKALDACTFLFNSLVESDPELKLPGGGTKAREELKQAGVKLDELLEILRSEIHPKQHASVT